MRTVFNLPIRTVAPWLAVVLLGASGLEAFAARLGVMTVRSAQGQPFDAEIALTDWDETSERPRVIPVESLRVKLAGGEERVWPTAWLDTSRVGNTVVRVRTEFEMSEPVFELTLRIESDRGRMVVTYPVSLRPQSTGMTGVADRVRGVVALDDVGGATAPAVRTPGAAADAPRSSATTAGTPGSSGTAAAAAGVSRQAEQTMSALLAERAAAKQAAPAPAAAPVRASVPTPAPVPALGAAPATAPAAVAAAGNLNVSPSAPPAAQSPAAQPGPPQPARPTPEAGAARVADDVQASAATQPARPVTVAEAAKADVAGARDGGSGPLQAVPVPPAMASKSDVAAAAAPAAIATPATASPAPSADANSPAQKASDSAPPASPASEPLEATYQPPVSPPTPDATPAEDPKPAASFEPAPAQEPPVGEPRVDRSLSHPLANIALMILAVMVLAGSWLLMLARRGRKTGQRPAAPAPAPAPAPVPAAVRSPSPVPATSAPDDAQRADPWLKMSELERAIGGRFDLPSSLDLESDRTSSDESRPSAQPSDLGANQRLAQSLEQAAACLRRNQIDEARRLLEAVVRDGDETQREFARTLLSRLG